MPRYDEHPWDEYVRHTRQLDPEQDLDWRRRMVIEDERMPENVIAVLADGRIATIVLVGELEDAA